MAVQTKTIQHRPKSLEQSDPIGVAVKSKSSSMDALKMWYNFGAGLSLQ